MKWRVGVMASLLAVAVTGCGIIGGDNTPTKTSDPVPADVIEQRGLLRDAVYAADVTANQARDTAVIHCGNLPFKDLISPKCKAEPQRKDLYEKSRACVTATENYNKIRGTENEIVRFQSTNPRRKNQWITCAFDQN